MIIIRDSKPAEPQVGCRKAKNRRQPVRRAPTERIPFSCTDWGWTREQNSNPLPPLISGFRGQSDLPAWVFSLDLPFEPAKT